MSNNQGNNKRIVIILAVLLLLSWIFAIFNSISSSKEKSKILSERDAIEAERQRIQAEYDLTKAQLEKMMALNDSLNNRLRIDQSLISRLKHQISELMASSGIDIASTGNPKRDEAARAQAINNAAKIMNNKLKEAQALIQQLQAKIAEYMAELERIKAENEGLTKDKAALTEKNSQLQIKADTLETTNVVLKQKVTLASVLAVGDVALTGVRVSGGEEKELMKPNKMSLLRVKFNVLENRIVESGPAEFYVALTDANGTLLTENADAANTNKLTLVDGTAVSYTTKISTEYIQGQRKALVYDFRGAAKFQEGVYNVIIYNKGYKVGQTSATFKKGFLGIF